MKVSEDIYLKAITLEDHSELYKLMQRIYPPAYLNYWKDNGEWYVNDLYNFENVQKELQEENSAYYFVILNEQTIGIIRIVYGLNTNYEKEKHFVKLHRLYLDQSIQNKGVGFQLMQWLFTDAKEKGYKTLWLEVMDKQFQALHFYQKLGFQEVDKVTVSFELLFDDYRGMYKMRKRL